MWQVRLALAAFALVVLRAQTEYTPASIADGGRLFRANCVACHGPEGDMVQGVDLGHGKFRRASSDSGLIKIIKDGIAGTAMPPHSLSDFQAGTIVAYLRNMAAGGQTDLGKGDARSGKLLFEGKGGCVACHRVNGNGSRLGPDLSDIGALRRAVELRASIVDPNQDVLPQHRYYRATTRGGEIINGRLLNQDTFTVQILDSNENLRSLRRGDLREAGIVNDSPMPSYRDRLGIQELDDIVTYLISLKGAAKRP